MFIKITFKDLVNCAPDDNSYDPAVIVQIQNCIFSVPKNSFKTVVKNDGRSIILKIQKYYLNEHSIELELMEKLVPSISIPADLIIAIHKIS